MGLEDQKPTIILIGCQFIYAGVNLFGRAALLQDLSPTVFVVYRQFFAFLLILPFAVLQRRERKMGLDLRMFLLISLLAFIGVTVNQNIYFEGVYLASSSAATALTNLVPAITFVMAYTIGLEKINLRSSRSIAKIVGTVVCVAGALVMALAKGPKLLNMELMPNHSILRQDQEKADTWLLGCLLVFGSTCAWSTWLILQTPISSSYPDHLSLTAWMCLFATAQSGILAIILKPDIEAWKLNSFQLFSCFYGGVTSASTFFAQAWCISRRGPLFSAMFNPLSAVIVTIFATIFLHEELYTGSLVGALAVISGLYIVLWGKASDGQSETDVGAIQPKEHDVTIEDGKVSRDGLEEPLLVERWENINGKE